MDVSMVSEQDVQHTAMVVGRWARSHFLKGHTEQEAEKDIYNELVSLLDKAGVQVDDTGGDAQ